MAIVEWSDWVKRFGESSPNIGHKPEIKIAEMLGVDYNPVEAGKPEPLLWSEVLPIRKGDIERTLHLMKYSRKDCQVWSLQ